MDVSILIIFVLVIGIITGVYIGFMLGFSRAMREAASKMHGLRRPIIGIIVLIIGGLGLLVSLGSWVYTMHFVQVAARTSGTVIEMQQQKDKDTGSVSYAPTFRFLDDADRQHTVSSGFFQSPPEFHVGDVVPVFYLRDDPQAARIDSFWQMWGLPSLAGILGCMAALIGAGLVTWPKIMGRLKSLLPKRA